MNDQNRQPFEQIPYEALPDQPRREHCYEQSDQRRLEVTTEDFGSVDTHYRVFGEGPPLLLVHGLMTSSYSWRYLLDGLGDHFTLYAPDLPGAGDSEKVVDASYAPRRLADWIAAFQRAVDIRGCPAIGNSLGGYLCMWLALCEPEAISRLVNVHSPGVPSTRLKLLGTLGRLPGLPRLIAWLARRNPERWAHEHVHYYDESLKSKEEAAVYAAPISSPEGSLTFAKYLLETLDTGAMEKFVDRLKRRRDAGEDFPVPLLLLYAERDPMVPPEIGDQLADLIPASRHETLERASHFAHIDAPERFVDRVLPFLRE